MAKNPMTDAQPTRELRVESDEIVTPIRNTRWPWIVAGVALVVVLALGVTELVMRNVVPNTMADIARDAVGLSDDHPVEVEVGGYVTPQVLFGSFNQVKLSADDVPLADGIRASVTAIAHDLPMDIAEAELGETHLTAKFTEEQLTEVLGVLSRGIGQNLEIEQEQLTVSHEFSLFGQTFPIKIAFLPSAVDGELHIAPLSVDAAGVLALTVDQLADFSLFAPYADGIDICIDEYIPAGVTLESLAISTTKTISFTVSLDPRIGMDEALQATGVCD